MTRQKKLRCQDIDALLDLELLDEKPNRAQIAAHLKTCDACQKKAPELAWFYGQFDEAELEKTPKPQRRILRRTAAAAAVLLMAVTMVLQFVELNPQTTTETSFGDSPIVTPTRILPSHFSTVEFGTTNIEPESSMSTTTAGGVGSLGTHQDIRSENMEWIR